MAWTIILAILIFFLLIFVHETGHLIAAKLTGVQVNEFMLGMGPKVAGFRRGETEYTFHALPIGGACVMEGEDEDSGNPRAFTNKPARVKAIVLFAGSLMNVLLAFVVMSLLIFYIGQPSLTLDTVMAQSPAAADGLQPGDTLVAVNGQPVRDWNAVMPALTEAAHTQLSNSAAGPQEGAQTARPPVTPSDIAVTLTVDRNGVQKTIATHLYYDAAGALKIGITPVMTRSPQYFFQSFGYGVQTTFIMTKMMYGALGQLVSGRLGISGVTGPVGIVVAVSDSVQYGAPYVWQLLALISLNLGIVNLLPFPALDGGRLIFLLIRKITGKAITNRVEGMFHLVGIMILFGFMIFITFQDVGHLIPK